MEVSTWNSLDVAKLIVSILTPVFVLILGIIINKSVENAERATGLRSEIYKTIGGDLNDIYCYLSFVGCWKDLSPTQVVAKKRAVDKAMYTYKPFFSQELFDTYHRFMIEAFKPFGGPGLDAKIRSEISTQVGDRRVHCSKVWEDSWERQLTKESSDMAQQVAYEKFMEQLARDLKL